MTSTPETPPPDSREDPSDPMAPADDTRGAEMGLTEDGSTFEPEEDNEAG